MSPEVYTESSQADKAPYRTAEVSTQMERLRESIESLEHRVEELWKKLTPIIGPSENLTEQVKDVPVDVQGMSPLAEGIRSSSRRVWECNTSLFELITRLEI